MKEKLPTPTIPKSRKQMADEYGLEIRAFNAKLEYAGIILAHGQIMPRDQMRIYRALGPPLHVWTDQGFFRFP
ncbi:MAG TPA: hypothetical protein VI603_03655 [Saprospiraceae bacterium]|nr:hypothetical protein [Saprospiraceae bacterium]